jgi:tetratricopeptide (TPR) repeat protein
LLLARLMTSLDQRGVGFEKGVTWWSYALTSCRSVVLYLKLAIWPHPLVFDYGPDFVQHAATVWPYILALVVLVAGLVMVLRQRPIMGFAGAWFFVILAPTSSVVPIVGQPMAESRMYLPLAAVIGLAVLGLYRWMGRRSLVLFAAVAVGLGWLSVRRNEDYRSELAIVYDTAVKQPDNARAHDCLGSTLLDMPGRLDDAIAECQAALRIDPDFANAHNTLGSALMQIPGRLPDAMAEFQAALRIDPDSAEAHANLGNALLRTPGRLPEAIAECQTALRIKPDLFDAHYNLGLAWVKEGAHLPEAIAQYEAALRIKPESPEVLNGLANAYLNSGRFSDAIPQYEAALRLEPNFAEAHYNLGAALLRVPGRALDAKMHFQEALRIRPNFEQAQEALQQLQSTH